MSIGNEHVTTLEGLLNELETYVNMDTPSGDKEHLDALSAILREEFLKAGCAVTTLERAGGNLLECRLGTGKKQILFLGHMDTVFAAGTVAQRPFVREGNILRGPGVLDMKGGVLMILEIMRRFHGKLPADWSLVALLNCDEEIGSGESKDRIMELAGESEYCMCMEPSKPEYCTVARKGLITFTVDCKGIAAHSGVNYHLGHSAIRALSHIIMKLYTMRDDEKGISVNIGGIQGGAEKGNIVADSAHLIGEVRYYDPKLVNELTDRIRTYCADADDEKVASTLNILASRPPMQQSERSKWLYEQARTSAEKNGLTLTARTHGGGSDGSYAAFVGCPVIDGMGPEGEFSHTTEEYVRADTLLQRLETCIDLINTLCAQ